MAAQKVCLGKEELESLGGFVAGEKILIVSTQASASSARAKKWEEMRFYKLSTVESSPLDAFPVFCLGIE